MTRMRAPRGCVAVAKISVADFFSSDFWAVSNPILDPEKTAAKIVKAIEKNVDFKGIPWSFHFIRLMEGLLPTKVFDWFFGELFGIYHTMDHFTGRK